MWSLFCPAEAPGLQDVYGPEFDALYTKYEQAGRARKTIKAQVGPEARPSPGRMRVRSFGGRPACARAPFAAAL
jgi:hypothetical protein